MRLQASDIEPSREGDAASEGIEVILRRIFALSARLGNSRFQNHNSRILRILNLKARVLNASSVAAEGRVWCISLLGVWILLAGAVGGQESDDLRVRVEVSPGTHYVGQAIELRVGVVGAGQRPEVDRPTIGGADVWLLDNTGLKPLSVTGIGGMLAGSNLFVSRFCVVPRRAGPLEIPAIRAHVRDESGRSRPVKLTIRPVPVEGRPADFLGGVGRFEVEASAEPKVLRVGQELEYRISVTGPAAWGMSDRPELKRFDRLPIGLRIQPKPTEMTTNPPLRRFVYRLRTSRPGEAVLPPVAIASFDPASSRYITRYTAGLPIRVVAVPTFDPAGFEPPEPTWGSGTSTSGAWTVGILSGILLLGAAIGLVRVRRRTQVRRLHGPAAARRYAARLARSLSSMPLTATGDPSPPGVTLALAISSGLIRYLEIGLGRPPGALTPEEAQLGVADCTGSDELGIRAGQLADRCDGMLYRDAPGPPEDDPRRLRDDARGLYAALGRARPLRD